MTTEKQNVQKPVGDNVEEVKPQAVPEIPPGSIEVEPPNVLQRLNAVQAELKAPKGQYNSFGKYNYRSAEDILEAVKPLLAKHGAIITLSDNVLQIGDRVYVEATAVFYDIVEGDRIPVTAMAREAEAKKGMDEAQITGAASSYARKYALNGLLAIDDTKDADTQDNSKEGASKLTEAVKKEIDDAKTTEELREIYKKHAGKGKDVEEYMMKKSKELKGE